MAHCSRRTMSTVLLAAASLTLTAGCSSSSSSSPKTSPTRKAEQPVVSTAQADRIVDTYQSLNNQANARLSTTLLAKAEGGAMLAFDRAYFKQAHGLDQKDVKANLAPFVYVHRTFYIPPAASKADWFMMKAQGADLKDGKPGTVWTTTTRFLVFRHTSGGWRSVVAGDFSGAEQKDVPRIAVDRDGLAQVADPTAKIGSTAPKDLPAQVTDLYVTGGTNSTLTKTKARDAAISDWGDRTSTLDDHAFADYKKTAPRDGTTYALRTADGGALVLDDSGVDKTVLAKDLNSYVTIGKNLQPFVKNGGGHMYQVVQHLMQTELGVIPPSGHPAAYGIDQQTTGVDATPMSSV